MDRTLQSFFGHGRLEEYALGYVRELRVNAGLECRKCRKYSVLDIDHLEQRHGPELTLGEIARRARCGRCGGVRPVILLHHPVIRRERGWYPRPPGATR